MAAWRFRFSWMVSLGSLGKAETLGIRRKGLECDFAVSNAELRGDLWA